MTKVASKLECPERRVPDYHGCGTVADFHRIPLSSETKNVNRELIT